MKDFIYYNDLYDCYKELLTKKQKEYFEDYYFSNLSLGEIADNYNVSRNAVHKQLQITINKLKEYEGKLNIYKNKKEIESILEETDINKIKNIHTTIDNPLLIFLFFTIE